MGIFFYHESYCDESGIIIIYGFLNIQIFCDVSSGVGLCPDEMENARCSIELGSNRFVQATEWRDEICIDIREWEIKDGKQIPHEKGDQSPTTWNMESRKVLFFARILLKQGQKDSDQKNTSLRPGEYAELKDVISVICDFVPELNSVVPCPYRSD
jgi:hypothetical protein